ncbi:GNAT family N-acetyltransferase [Prolixibacteraceae bacterium Z1-6]|uniref:GNAT family N-acetyltransferase n=1 Tax=Draconibacterium aestuarii TaxID=2998507 RepID=A0A9X3F7C8_9BACT|nr:GNAT family N-acetyltransferase [Prolixibacteraceae bacterium Z1-6]
MQFSTLEKLTISELTVLFNKSFADYFVKIEFTPDLLKEKIYSEDIQLDKSVGVFLNNEPTGFILHAIRNNRAYNAGTGVIPAFRGNNATCKMYDFILPILKKAGVSEIELEVIQQNTPAIKSYRKIGFEKENILKCFEGKINASPVNKHIKVKETTDTDFAHLEKWWNWKPTWQYSTETIKKSSSYKVFCAFLNNRICGYMVANLNSGRVAQFAVNPANRNQGIATALLQHLSDLYNGQLTINNVDGEQPESLSFLTNRSLNPFLTQYKMKLILTT